MSVYQQPYNSYVNQYSNQLGYTPSQSEYQSSLLDGTAYQMPSQQQGSILGSMGQIGGVIGQGASLLGQGSDWFTGSGQYGPQMQNLKGLTGDNLLSAAYSNQQAMMNQDASPMDMGMGLMNAWNMYSGIMQGNRQLDLYEEQMGIVREQHQMTKDEVARIGKVRQNLNRSYNS